MDTCLTASEGQDMGRNEKRAVAQGMDNMPVGPHSRQNRMKKLPRIKLAEPVIHGVLKIVWNDGYEGIVDSRPTIARGRIFTYLQNAENFSKCESVNLAIRWNGRTRMA